MILKSLELLNFKNYEEASVTFGEEINCLTGPNGSGKTNLLDAIHYLSLCRSYFTATDIQNIRHNEKFFMVKGIFTVNNSEEEITCTLKAGQKKQFIRNKNEYARLNEHIGLIPVVMIAPADQELVTGGSDERRKFLDRIIVQVDRPYLENLIAYNRILEQRNAFLKQWSGLNGDRTSLQVWNEQLISYGEKIYNRRKIFIEKFIPLFQKFYEYVTEKKEKAELEYYTQLHKESFASLLDSAFEKDKAVQFTTAGIHKDDLFFSIGGHSAKKFGSQGQQKSYVMALKLAQFEFLRKKKQMKPIVMLDDLFDKLDDFRVSKIIHLVKEHSFGQLFISDTHPERVFRFLRNFDISFDSFTVNNGIIQPEITHA